jgi:outer membrane protein assembly factor BamB
MNRSLAADALPLALVVAGVVSLMYLWLSADAAVRVEERVPIASNVVDTSPEDTGDILEQAEHTSFDGVAADLPGVWPQFRGPNLDAIAAESVTLAREWPDEGPPVLWSVDLGEGYAGAAVLNGRVYVADYDQEKRGDAIRCFSLADGQEIWRYFYPIKVKRNHGMSRTVPAVTEDHVVTLGPKCHLVCLDARSGELNWFIDLVTDHGARVPTWYAGQCPLVEDGKVIVGVGGDSLMMAVDIATGQVVWETPNAPGWKMTHSSIVPVEAAGTRMYAWCASGGVVGVSAQDGTLLWETTEWKINIANVPTPVPVGNGRLFLSGGYNAGAMMLKLNEQDGAIRPEILFRLEPEVFGAEQQTPILYEGYLYGVRPDEQLVCLDLDGQIVWKSGSTDKFGLGPFTIVNGVIYVMDDDGTLAMAEATPTGYVPLDAAKVLEGPESWGPMAVAGGRLLVRDLNRMVCLDVTSQ